MRKTISLLIIIFIFSSCKSKLEDESVFPEVNNVNDIDKTDFVPTLESSFKTNNNIIYCATFLFAWNEIKKTLGKPLTNFTNKELEVLNENKSFFNVLKEEEYETSVEIRKNIIEAKAYFRKSLPFEIPMTKFKESLNFGKSKVESFGFWGSCEFAKINYFNNENDFSVSLFPKNKEHEIILIMTQNVKQNFSEISDFMKKKSQNNKNLIFNDMDKVEIPIIEFNLEKDFSQFIGSKFQSGMTENVVNKAYQQNAFKLNENGAKIESEAIINITKEAVEEVINISKPKRMIFNKPFVILLKRKDAENPYFGIYIANDELLKKK